jgi:hypothetical protein
MHGQEPLLEQNLLDAFVKAGSNKTLKDSAMTLVVSMTGKMSLMR